jgi:hypothetical protein
MVTHCPAVDVQPPKSQSLSSSAQQSSLEATEPTRGGPLRMVSKYDEGSQCSVWLTFVFSFVKYTLYFEVGLIPSCCPWSRIDHEPTQISAH